MKLRAWRSLVPVVVLALRAAGCGAGSSEPAKPETTWKPVGTWSGRGNQVLETFPMERVTWRVQWETRNAPADGSGTFHLTANSGDSGRIVAEITDLRTVKPGSDRDTSYVTEIPHRYYFVVTSTGVDWTVTAEEPVLP